MKTTLLLMIALAALSATYAQENKTFGFEKGDFIISGTMSYSNQNSDSFRSNIDGSTSWSDSKGYNFNFIPEVGYFISPSFMTGIKLGYISFKNQSYSDSGFESYSKGNGYSTSLFGRYYFSAQKRISLFIELDAGYSKISSDSEVRTSLSNLNIGKNDNTNYSVAASPGINLFINKNLSLTSRIGKLSYAHIKDTYSNSEGDTSVNRRNGFNANINLNNFYFGVLYRI
ncbi:hypothetical protein [uncultured Aquimarina sp.]|uniref:hypothetical protein n=1 Tax=uncultured Aquimarina sp. TaxID=575652 RepID=UPI00261741EF|nr:hypothetical protein [uncultured Aquimarina sp.]